MEDDPQVAEFLTVFFANHPQELETDVAYDGFDAGRKAAEFDPDVVLLDLMMPGLDGFDVCLRLKSSPATKSIEIIAMTGYYNSDNVERIPTSSAKACLRKPLDTSLLCQELGLSDFD